MNDFKQNLEATGEIGFTLEAFESMAYLSGLPTLKPNELVVFETGEVGKVNYLEEDRAEVMVFSKFPVRVGTKATGTDRTLQIPVGKEYLGQIVDPFGNLLDLAKTFTKPTEFRSIDIDPPGIDTRIKIDKVFETGVSLVDLLIPLGLGQRELIIGDRKTGKTQFLLQSVFNQAKLGVICIYVAIGKKKHDIKVLEGYFQKKGVMDKVIIIAASAEDALSTIFVSPFSGMTFAEYFKDQGQDVLLVMDDLNTHAKFYREIALLAKRFPGRNSYPADIFYTHAKLLERAGNFKSNPKQFNKSNKIAEKKSISITCLPVAETVQGDITGYIQTNLMSMTDGHVYFDVDLFAKGRRPAVNPFLSVTRVGRQTQDKLRQTINRELTSFMTLREKIENFAHFGAETSSSIKNTLITGDQIIAFFDQTSEVVLPLDLQTFIFTLIWYGVWRGKSLDTLKADMTKIMIAYETKPEYKKAVESIIKEATSLNELLNVVKEKAGPLLVQAGIK